MKFDKDPLAVEQNYYATKIVNVYIAYDLDAWPRNPPNNSTFKNCLFCATSIVKKEDKGKYVYMEKHWLVRRLWSFNDDSARNVLIFGVHKVIHLMLTIARIIF